MFTDSIQDNLEAIRELLLDVPLSQRERAKRAASNLENAFTQLQKDYPKDITIALGAAFAIFALAQRLVDAPKQGDNPDRGTIQLLS